MTNLFGRNNCFSVIFFTQKFVIVAIVTWNSKWIHFSNKWQPYIHKRERKKGLNDITNCILYKISLNAAICVKLNYFISTSLNYQRKNKK